MKSSIRRVVKALVVLTRAVAIVGMVFLALGCSSESSRKNPKAIRIGAVASLTGAAASEGESWLMGARLAAQELSTADSPIEVMVEDDQTNPASAARAYHSLVQLKKVAVVLGGTWDFLLKPIEPLALKSGVPLITPTNPYELLNSQAETLTTAISLGAERAAVRTFLKTKGVKRLALVYSAIPWGDSHADLIREIAAELGIEVVYSERFPLDSYLDVVRTVALRLREKAPDLVFVVFEAQGLAQFLEELDRLKLQTLVLNPMHLDRTAELLAARPELLSRAFGIFPKVQDRDFAKRFESRYQKPPRVYAAEGYDAVKLATEVMRRGGKLTRSAGPIEVAGVTGPLRLPAPQGGVGSAVAVVRGVLGGKLFDVE